MLTVAEPRRMLLHQKRSGADLPVGGTLTTGCMTRLWQTALLAERSLVLRHLLLENQIYEFQGGRYAAIAACHSAGKPMPSFGSFIRNRYWRKPDHNRSSRQAENRRISGRKYHTLLRCDKAAFCVIVYTIKISSAVIAVIIAGLKRKPCDILPAHV